MIIDASVGVKWLVRESDSDKAEALIGAELVVPTLFFAEVANAMWKKARLGELDLAPVIAELPKLKLLTTSVDETDLAARALQIAAELDHPVYDCVYLALAESRDDVLISVDRKFLNKVAKTTFADRVRPLG